MPPKPEGARALTNAERQARVRARKAIDTTRLVDLGDAVKVAAMYVLKGMRENPGGDAYVYHGSMAAVECLRDAVNDLKTYQIMGDG